MRVLALSSPSATHFMPAVPLAWALRAAGHEVVLAGQPDVMGMARGAGLPAVSVGHLYDGLGALNALPAGKRPLEAGFLQMPKGSEPQLAAAWVFHAKYLLHPYLELAQSWRPDLILTDALEYAGLAVGGVLGVPVVQHRWAAESVTSVGLNLARMMLDAQARRLGAADGVPAPAMVLDPFPAAFAVPDAPAGTPVRPIPYNGGGVAPELPPRTAGRRRVCVSFGMATVELNGLPLIRHIADAFDGLDEAEAVVTLDRAHQERLGPVPGNVILIEPAPLTSFIDTCDAVVHHGGAGTLATALMAGIPHLLFPQMWDHHERCAQMARAGAAICLETAEEQNDPAGIHKALAALLGEPGYRETAAALRAESERLPSPAEITARLERL